METKKEVFRNPGGLVPNTPLLQYSNTPTLHDFTTPALRYSSSHFFIFPTLQYSITPEFQGR
jgi:hypothetical protein